MLLLEGAYGGDGDDALNPELLEAMNVGAEIEFAWKDPVSASVASQERDFTALEHSADVGIGGTAKRGPEANFFDFGEAGHGIKPASANDSNFRL